MKCIGKAKLLNMEIEEKRTVGQCYFATNVAPKGKEPKFENDFCNVVLLGKAHTAIKEIAKMDDIEKYPIFITESQLRLKTGKRKDDDSYWYYNEIVVFDFEEVEQEQEQEQEQPKKQTRNQKTKYRR